MLQIPAAGDPRAQAPWGESGPSWRQAGSSWITSISQMLSVRRYRARWPLIPAEEFAKEGETVPPPGCHEDDGCPLEDRWILYMGHESQSARQELRDMWFRSSSCFMCVECMQHLSKRKPTMPPAARANDLFGCQVPEPIACLSYAETKVLQLARACVPLKRAMPVQANGKAALRKTYQWMLQGKNIVAYPQQPEKLLSACLILRPDELCDALAVQFVGEDREVVRQDPSLKVSATYLESVHT